MREYRLLNNNWKFTYGDKVGASPDEINRWQDIGLPHSFGIPYFMEKEFYLGYGTYSKWFELSKEDCKKRILLKFFGAFQKAVVVLNGKADWGTSGRLHTIFGRINRKYTAGTKCI